MTRKEFRNNGGYGLLIFFGGSPFKAISSIYPNYNLNSWLFDKTSTNYFKNKENKEKYIKWLSEKVGVKPGDLQAKHFMDNSGRSLLSLYNGSPQNILKSLDSKFDSNEIKVLKSRKPRNFWVCFLTFFLFFFFLSFRFCFLSD